jgi:hypothetical protein
MAAVGLSGKLMENVKGLREKENIADDCSTSSGETGGFDAFRPHGQAGRDFYYKGWRGESQHGEGEDPLQVILQNTNNGRNLKATLQKLLESGGDERSVADPKTGLTKYHTPTAPCEGIHRSCCTSNVPAKEAFSRGLDTLRQLILEAKNISKQENKEMIYTSPEDLYRKLLCDIRERLRSVLELSFEDLISLFPSGTDAELMPAVVACTRAAKERADNKRGHEVFSIVTAAGEVGSGTTLASMGQHFAKQLPSGRFTSKDERQVFDDRFSSIDLGLRDSDGRLLSLEERDQIVERAVEQASQAIGTDGLPRFGCIVVHMVLGSKTGKCMPSSACLDRLVKQYGSLVLPVVDACQGRLKPLAIRECLDKERVVLCTGSKFFGGPPFSGVCLLSQRVGKELEHALMMEDAKSLIDRSKLREYIVASLLSDDLPNMRALLPQRPLNYGVLMRWTFALHSMESFFVDVPRNDRFKLMASWAEGVRDIVTGLKSPFVELLHDNECGDDAGDDQGVALSTIVSFHCRCNRDDQKIATPMTMDELRHVQFLMASDLTEMFPQQQLLEPAKIRCFMGQPVDLTPGRCVANVTKENVLRVALSAPMVVRLWQDGIEKVLAEDRAVFEKLQLILGNWCKFQPTSKPQ